MASIEKFLGKSKKVNIEGEEIDIWPLRFDDTDLIVKFGDKDPNVRSGAIKELVRKSLKKSFPEATEEQIGNFDARYVNIYLTALFETSGLEIDKKKLESMMAETF